MTGYAMVRGENIFASIQLIKKDAPMTHLTSITSGISIWTGFTMNYVYDVRT